MKLGVGSRKGEASQPLDCLFLVHAVRNSDVFYEAIAIYNALGVNKSFPLC